MHGTQSRQPLGEYPLWPVELAESSNPKENGTLIARSAQKLRKNASDLLVDFRTS